MAKINNFVLVIGIFVLLAGVYGGCNGDNSSNNSDNGNPTPMCLDANVDPDILEDNSDCPSAAIVQICSSFSCGMTESGDLMNTRVLNVTFQPSNCLTMGCFDFDCSLSIRDVSDPSNRFGGMGEFTIDTVNLNTMEGTVTVEEDGGQGSTQFDYQCSPLIF